MGEGGGTEERTKEYGGFTFRFVSLAEVREAVRVLGRKLLPTSRRMSAGRGAGPNGHWLSRLPGEVLPWRYREGAPGYLREALEVFEEEVEV